LFGNLGVKKKIQKSLVWEKKVCMFAAAKKAVMFWAIKLLYDIVLGKWKGIKKLFSKKI